MAAPVTVAASLTEGVAPFVEWVTECDGERFRASRRDSLTRSMLRFRLLEVDRVRRNRTKNVQPPQSPKSSTSLYPSAVRISRDGWWGCRGDITDELWYPSCMFWRGECRRIDNGE